MNVFKEKMKERTLGVAIKVLRLCDEMQKTTSNTVVVNQVSRSATSIGANYRAACRAKSKADFVNKLHIVEEECDETIYWIELLVAMNDGISTETRAILGELNDILAIVVSALKTAKGIG